MNLGHLLAIVEAMTDKQQTKPRKSQARKPNRAQVRAAEVRAAETRVDVQQAIDSGTYEAPASTTARSRARQRKVGQTSLRASHLTRVQEYSFIRTDFRRLLVTAGSLLVLMMVILVVVEGI